MSNANKIMCLEIRLHRLTTRNQENQGICRKIEREIRRLERNMKDT